MRTAIYLGCIIFCLSSCITTKNSAYFKTIQKDTTLQNVVTTDFESKIVKGDNLAITVSSLSATEDLLFNYPVVANNSGANPGYLVRSDGTFKFHKLGNVLAEGLTRRQLADKLHDSLLPYLKDPLVTVQFLNHKVTILGAVRNPQVLNIKDDRITLLDLIAISGDVREDALTDKVMVIREENGQRQVKKINLQNHSLFSSEWYYLQPNDIVYVMPDEEAKAKLERRNNLQSTLSFAASGVTLLVIILDRIIK